MSNMQEGLLFSLLPPPVCRPPILRSSQSSSSDNNCGVSSVCFLGPPSNGDTGTYADNEAIFLNQLKCRAHIASKFLAHESLPSASSSTAFMSPAYSFSNKLLGSCQYQGNAHIWDLSLRRVTCPVLPIDDSRFYSPGLCLLRLQDTNTCSQFLYQTRDNLGSISIHDLQHTRTDSTSPSLVHSFHSYSQSFCSATVHVPSHILAYTTQDTQHVEIRDFRIHAQVSQPIARFHGAPKTNSENECNLKKHGMVTSLNFCSGPLLLLACGMESGNIFYHDLRMLGEGILCKEKVSTGCISSTITETLPSSDHGHPTHPFSFASISLGDFPILSIDTVPSTINPNQTPTTKEDLSLTQDNKLSSTQYFPSYPFVSIAGMAADADTLLNLPEHDRGTVAVIKGNVLTPHSSSLTTKSHIMTRVRARVKTCKLDEHDGKPGVNICRFHPKGHVFAVGGWDNRLRIYSRTSARPLAVWKGTNNTSTPSVTALDWSNPISFPIHTTTNHPPTSLQVSVLASGTSDGHIYLWNAFPVTESTTKL